MALRLKMKKMPWKTTKINNGLNFNVQILSYWLGPYGQKKSFRYSAKIGLWQTFRLSIFSAARNALTKATDFVTFGFSFLTSLVSFPLKESLNVSVSKRYGFFSVLAAVIRTNTDKRPWIEDGQGFAAHTLTWPRGAIDTIGAIPKIISPNTSCSWTCFAAKLIFWS